MKNLYYPFLSKTAKRDYFFLIVLLCLMPATGAGQTSTQAPFDDLVVSYVANIPEQPLGISFIALTPTGWGFYGDIKTGIGAPSDDELYESISISQAENTFNDKLLDKHEEWLSVNLGVARSLLEKTLALYVGVGLSFSSNYRQYNDKHNILGDNGEYWILDEDEDEVETNFLGGIYWFASEKIALSLGVETQPEGISLGIGYRFLR